MAQEAGADVTLMTNVLSSGVRVTAYTAALQYSDKAAGGAARFLDQVGDLLDPNLPLPASASGKVRSQAMLPYAPIIRRVIGYF